MAKMSKVTSIEFTMYVDGTHEATVRREVYHPIRDSYGYETRRYRCGSHDFDPVESNTGTMFRYTKMCFGRLTDRKKEVTVK